jgi:nitrogen fixation protein FixH
VAIIALLSFGVGANVIFMLVAINDPSFAVEPDYYRKALAWDQSQAEAAESKALGWQVAIGVDRDRSGRDELLVTLSDQGGAPIPGAQLEIEAFHNAHAAQRLKVDLQPDQLPGAYKAQLPPMRRGLWEFRVRAVRGAEHFTRTLLQDVGI